MIFYIIGLGFGTSYSLIEVDQLDVVSTNWKKRIVRAIIGIGISVVIDEVFDYLSE